MASEWASALLAQERATTLRRLSALTAEFDGIVASAEGTNGDDEHDPEGATIAFERERTAALRLQTERRLDEIDRAISRLGGGRYGICRSCEQHIAEERLRAIPEAELCTKCVARRAPSQSSWQR